MRRALFYPENGILPVEGPCFCRCNTPPYCIDSSYKSRVSPPKVGALSTLCVATTTARHARFQGASICLTCPPASTLAPRTKIVHNFPSRMNLYFMPLPVALVIIDQKDSLRSLCLLLLLWIGDFLVLRTFFPFSSMVYPVSTQG